MVTLDDREGSYENLCENARKLHFLLGELDYSVPLESQTSDLCEIWHLSLRCKLLADGLVKGIDLSEAEAERLEHHARFPEED